MKGKNKPVLKNLRYILTFTEVFVSQKGVNVCKHSKDGATCLTNKDLCES